MEARLSLQYEGPAVDSGLMPVHEAAAAMVAFSDFMVAVVRTTYGEQTEAHANVAGFGHGSFITDMVFQVGAMGASIFGVTPSVKDLFEVLKQSFDLWKFLKGEPPKNVMHV